MDFELRNEERPASPTRDPALSAQREEDAETSGGVRVAAPDDGDRPAGEEPVAEAEPAPVTPLPLEKRIKARKKNKPTLEQRDSGFRKS